MDESDLKKKKKRLKHYSIFFFRTLYIKVQWQNRLLKKSLDKILLFSRRMNLTKRIIEKEKKRNYLIL